MAGFLAVDYVIAGFYTHQELDAALGAFEVIGGGFPDELAVVGYAEDVEGRDHRGGFISQTVETECTGLDRAGISDGGSDRLCREGAQHAAPLQCLTRT